MKKQLIIILSVVMLIILSSSSLSKCDDPITPGPRNTILQVTNVLDQQNFT